MVKKSNTLFGVGFLMLGLFIVPLNDALAKILTA
jgi:hypothetical protein